MNGALRIPAEWERHDACWLAFPYIANEWSGHLERGQRAVAELCRAIAGPGSEPVRLLVKDEQVERTAREQIGDDADVDYIRADYGDCWVRDTAPLFGHTESGSLAGLRFSFNCWGGKFEIPFDDTLGSWLTDRLGAEERHLPMTLEGGALEFDGQGTFITTVSCVLNNNRNPGLTRAAFEDALGAHVALKRLIWLDEGLEHDHTDGHVDMVARFVAKDTVLCMAPSPSAPNARVLATIARDLAQSGLRVVQLPAPPPVRDHDGAPLPATYCNFYVANRAVIVPTYGVPEDERALSIITEVFPGRETIGLPALDLLCGGGAFHCATQPQPAAP